MNTQIKDNIRDYFDNNPDIKCQELITFDSAGKYTNSIDYSYTAKKAMHIDNSLWILIYRGPHHNNNITAMMKL